MPELTGGEAVYEALRALDVRHVFGIVSVHNIPIYDAIRRGGGIEAIAVRHEQAAVHAADGYARATGRLGVAIASTGPGTTNAMTGLFEAASASSPVLLVTGQIESVWYGKGKGFLHEAERQLDMLRTVCREAATVRYAEEIGEQVVRAGLAAQRGRQQPCAVEIPIDLQYRRTQIPIPFVEGPPRLAPDPGSLERAAEAIARARRRLIWAGGGVVAGGAHEALLQLAERLAAPVFTTINGRTGEGASPRPTRSPWARSRTTRPSRSSSGTRTSSSPWVPASRERPHGTGPSACRRTSYTSTSTRASSTGATPLPCRWWEMRRGRSPNCSGSSRRRRTTAASPSAPSRSERR